MCLYCEYDMPSYIISSVYACIKLNVRNIPQYLCKHLHFPRNKNKQIDTCFYMAHVCVCVQCDDMWCWRSPRWWSKQAVSDLTMYVVILGGKKCTQTWVHMMDVVFFNRRLHSKQPGQLGFQRDLFGMLGFGSRRSIPTCWGFTGVQRRPLHNLHLFRFT